MSELLRLIPEEDQGKTVEVAFSKLMTLHQAFLQNYKEFENIETNHQAKVHYKENCPLECLQMEMCGVMREALQLARTIGKTLGDKDPIYENLQCLGRAQMTRINHQKIF